MVDTRRWVDVKRDSERAELYFAYRLLRRTQVTHKAVTRAPTKTTQPRTTTPTSRVDSK